MAAESKKILYLGDDEAYFKILHSEFQRIYPGMTFLQFTASTPKGIQHLMREVQLKKPEVVFIDFSKHTDDFVHLSRILAMTNKEKPLPIIGLHDYLSKPENIKLSYLAGVMINHIKGAEVFDVVFSAVNLATPGQAKKHGFATAKIKETALALYPVKIGFLSENTLHIETDLDFKEKEELRIQHQWIGRKMIPSTLVQVRKTSQEMLFYNFKRSIDLEFLWIDPIIETEEDEPARIKELKDEREHNIIKARKTIKNWIAENSDLSQHKSIRVLVIDRNFSFYNNRPRSDSYGYALRCQPFLNNIDQELLAQRPQVIALSLDQGDEKFYHPNDMDLLERLVKFIKNKMADAPPYIVIFNIKDIKSKELQSKMQYENILTYEGDIEPDTMLKMAKIFSDRIQNLIEVGAIEAKFVVKKSSPYSIGEIEEEVELQQISETDLIIKSERPLHHGASFRFQKPFQGLVTIVDHPQLTKPPLYYGLINGIGEIEKRNLRKHVNSIFFKDLDAAKAQELESFQNLNQAKLDEILAKKQAELEAKEAAEAAIAADTDEETKEDV